MKKTLRTQRSTRRAQRHSAYLEALEPRQLLSGLPTYFPTWTINGDADRAQPNDTITVVYNATTKNFDLTINGTLVASRPANRVRTIVVNGGKGDDTISVDSGGLKIKAVLNGGAGNDVLTGGAGNEILNGNAGNDTLNGGEGNDTLNGGAGIDTLNGDAGNDRLYGGADDDGLSGGEGNDTLIGNDGFDTLTGDAGNDRLYGSRGNDTLAGGDGNDLLIGGASDDILNGNVGNDRLYGDGGNDTLIGGAGNDILRSGSGQNTLYAAEHDKYRSGRFDSVIDYDQPSDVPPTEILGGSQDPSHPTPQIPSDLRQRLIEEAVARYKDLFGTTYTNYPRWYCDLRVVLNEGVSRVFAMGSVDSAGIVSSVDHSDTNTQVAGVDEADLVETDGNFIYRLNGNQLSIIDVRDPATAHVVATMNFSGNQNGSGFYYGSPVGMYLVGNRLVVLTDSWPSFSTLQTNLVSVGSIRAGKIYTSAPQKTTAWVLDVSDPSEPNLIGKTNFSGHLASSRVIDDQLYLVLSNNLALPAPEAFALANTANSYIAIESGITCYPGPGQTYQYPSEAEYRAWLEANIDQYIPEYNTVLPDNTAGPSGSLIDTLAYDPGTPLSNITTVVNLDIANPTAGPTSITTAVGSPQTVYASADNLYVFTYTTDSTNILKFNLTPDGVTFDAAGHVNGQPLNSYAMDEYNGQLRIVTIRGIEHSLYVLSDDADGHLAVTGQVHNIGDGETLSSVLFVQDRAYVVTYRNPVRPIDPLFAIDLSDPANPTILGELIMPGFSSYLFPLDPDHLIGIGQTDNFGTVQISLFDVSDLTHPTIVDQEVYDTGSTSSIAQFEPHAFSYFPEQGVLSIPLYAWSTYTGTQSTLAVLQVDPDEGFTELGQVSHDSWVQRSLRIEDNLYSIAANNMKIVNLLHPTQVIADVNLAVQSVSVTPYLVAL